MENGIAKPGTDASNKFKTEICRNWTQGICEFGTKCTFAHGQHELRLRDTAVGNYRTKNCKQFHELGYCQYGSRCQFKHVVPDCFKDIKTASSSPRESNYDICKKRLPVFVQITES